MNKRDAELDGLLARGRLSAPQRERAFARIQRSVQWGMLSSPVLRGLAIAAPLAAAASFFLFQIHGAKPDEFSVRGGTAGHVEIDCDGASLSACPVGSTLIFRLAGLGRPAYLQAYAEPVSPSGERVWYFPTSGQPAPFLQGQGDEVLRRGIAVGEEHRPGRYRVHVLLSARPLDRPAIVEPDAQSVIEKDSIDLDVVAR